MTANLKSVPILIKLAKRQVDEHRDELARIVTARSTADAAVATHDAMAEAEANLARTSPEAMESFTRWMTHAARLRRVLTQRSTALERTERAARDALREAAAQLKRLESAFGTARASSKRLEGRREAARADERESNRAAL